MPGGEKWVERIQQTCYINLYSWVLYATELTLGELKRNSSDTYFQDFKVSLCWMQIIGHGKWRRQGRAGFEADTRFLILSLAGQHAEPAPPNLIYSQL